jgi:hypothetical protein
MIFDGAESVMIGRITLVESLVSKTPYLRYVLIMFAMAVLAWSIVKARLSGSFTCSKRYWRTL